MTDLSSPTNLSNMVNSILTLPHNNNLIQPQEEETSVLNLKGGKKNKKKQIDTYTKDKLVKIAKKHGIKLSSKGVKRTKEQLFNSLKRKKLI